MNKYGFMLIAITLFSVSTLLIVEAQTNKEILFPDNVGSIEYTSTTSVTWSNSVFFTMISNINYKINKINKNDNSFDVAFKEDIKVGSVSGIDVIGVEVVYSDDSTERLFVTQSREVKLELTRRVDSDSGKVMEVISETKPLKELILIYQFDSERGTEYEFRIGSYSDTGYVPLAWKYVYNDLNEPNIKTEFLTAGGTQYECYVIDDDESTYYYDKNSKITMKYNYEYDGGSWEILRDWNLTELTLKQAQIPGFPLSSIALGILTPFLLQRLRRH